MTETLCSHCKVESSESEEQPVMGDKKSAEKTAELLSGDQRTANAEKRQEEKQADPLVDRRMFSGEARQEENSVEESFHSFSREEESFHLPQPKAIEVVYESDVEEESENEEKNRRKRKRDDDDNDVEESLSIEGNKKNKPDD